MTRNEIKLVCTDIDGTLTDGRIYIGSDGEVMKSFDVKDGLGMAMAREKGIIFAIITGRESEIVKVRAKELGIEEIHQAVHKKIDVIHDLMVKYSLEKENVAYLGDDVNDLEPIQYVGMGVAVGDAHSEVIEHADVVLHSPGGRGAMREFLDNYVLKGV
ncbi:KdsC family phosphatase [Metabacillus indicus]|uniref:3-deoxy-D-manno-octulosonate 8-phosphate phosphatase n=1 Tax=Metabacillus indicus TaxID=246786 RepID=A0A084GXV4_METID|nr:HAD-IIIA family hydrolase [Metabacillus indicus]KEZ52166.1 hypothetical protein GS18_0213900 [Metabacillus indicus]